ncbi:hypothetical protein E8E12_001796 [Didymella heteroderae]|uniref:Uncharacterized protein n=1 Tax=Didymella heteroderae TaxID=1769908 RepID=A0A9P4WG57_9PLEO|nr:hypothetical protein E8E12_001796 [Didymella heteroderae]
MPPFGRNRSIGGLSKVENHNDNWAWSQQPSTSQPTYTSTFDPSMYANANFTPRLQPQSRPQPRHHSTVTSHVNSTGTATPPPPSHQLVGSTVKAQPAFKPTWTGFLDTTKDAMTIVEAALRGHLHHINRRPHDKERAEMLTSGAVLVYDENASGIKRWTDAMHWSPSRVMNNYLIYRQLTRTLRPEEKKTALNTPCGTKRKRKDSAGPSITKTGDNIDSVDKYKNPSLEGSFLSNDDTAGKVYVNFAQSLTPDQQRRFCGSLVDSYVFKEGGLMKKTISVIYQGTHHHVISYYSLEDVVSGKLKRPFQDPRLEHIQPRPELLAGWKASLEDKESKDMPLIAGCSQHIQPSHVQHHAITAMTQAVGPHGMIQPHGPPHLQALEYWHGGRVQRYASSHQSSEHYASPQPTAANNASAQPYQYPTQQAPPAQEYVQPPSSQPYPSLQSSTQSYPAPANTFQQYAPNPQLSRHYSIDQQQPTMMPQYPPKVAAPHYTASRHSQSTPPLSMSQYTVPSAPSFDVQVSVPQSATSTQPPPPDSVSQHDPQRRASAPVTLQLYTQTHYHPAPPHPTAYYVDDAKYPPNALHSC